MKRSVVTHGRRVVGGARKRPDLVQARSVGHETEAGNPAVGGLYAHGPAKRGRLADGTAGIGAERGKALPGGHGRGRTAARSAGDLFQIPGIGRDLVGGIFRGRAHGPLALEHVDGHRRLVVGGRGEHLAFAGRDGRVAVDQLGKNAAQSLDAQRQRGHVEQQHVLHVAGQDTALDGGAHDLVEVKAEGLGRGNAAGRGMRLFQVAGFGQVGHKVADGGRGQAQGALLGHGTRTDRQRRGDVGLDDGGQDFPFAIWQRHDASPSGTRNNRVPNG